MSDHQQPEDELHVRRDADKGREPQLVPGQQGHRLVSFAALVERVIEEFRQEYVGTDALRQADTSARRLHLILDVMNYVLGIESVQLTGDEKADIIGRIHSELFGYGPLDRLFADERITTIALEGADKASVRYGHGELTPLGPIFEDPPHFQRVIERLLSDAGAALPEGTPYLETGLRVGERPVCVNLVAPPVTFQLTADIRVHPALLPTLDDLIISGFTDERGADLLRALAVSAHGMVIAGETESGKTTLLSILAQRLPQPERITVVERAGELRLPDGAARLTTRWRTPDAPGITFGGRIAEALATRPGTLLLDEMRADEPESIAPLLLHDAALRQLWSFRGSPDPRRLQSALGMLARRADSSRSEEMVQRLFERLPFAVTVRRSGGALLLRSVGEWQLEGGHPVFVPLWEREGGEMRLSGRHPARALNLPEAFWSG